MVERRLRRRPFQVASPGIRTPCQTRIPELFFPAGEKPWIDADHPDAYDMARHLCARCGSRQWCLASAFAHPERYGMWGGATPAERARILVDLQATTARPERGSPGGSRLDRVTEPGKAPGGSSPTYPRPPVSHPHQTPEPFIAPQGQNESRAINKPKPTSSLRPSGRRRNEMISDLQDPRRQQRATRRSARHAHHSHNCHLPDLSHTRRQRANYERH
jgi:WhiB family transcriptional regulator, redox-sensing transcriptional regulator